MQSNSILAMFPHLDLNNNDSFLCDAKDLRQGYVHLQMCQTATKPVTDTEAIAILWYWKERDWPNLDA